MIHPVKRIKEIPCDSENKFEYQETYINMFKKNEFIREIIKIKNYNYEKDELTSQIRKKIWEGIISKSDAISLYLINNDIEVNKKNELIKGASDAQIRKHIKQIKHDFEKNLESKFKKIKMNLMIWSQLNNQFFFQLKKLFIMI